MGKSALGVEVPLADADRRESKEERMPERMATPIVPHPRTVMVRASGSIVGARRVWKSVEAIG